MPNTYETSFKVLLRPDALAGNDTPNQTAFSSDEIRRSRLNTEVQLVTGEDALRQVVAESHLDESIGLTHRPPAVRQQAALQRLQEDLVVKPLDSSNGIEARYTSSSPERAVDVLNRIFEGYLRSHRALLGTMRNEEANAGASAFPARIGPAPSVPNRRTLSRLYQRRSQQTRLTMQGIQQQDLGDLIIIEKPFMPEVAKSPTRATLLGLALLGSLVTAVAAIVCLERMSGRVHSAATVAQVTGVPVLATIPKNAGAPSFANAFPTLYLAMQRPRVTFHGRLS